MKKEISMELIQKLGQFLTDKMQEEAKKSREVVGLLTDLQTEVNADATKKEPEKSQPQLVKTDKSAKSSVG